MTLEMLTNATKITDRIAEQMCELLDNVTISLDGHERHLHEAQRGERTFAPTIDGIRRVVAAKKRLRSDKPFISIVPALTASTIGFMKEIFEFCFENLGANGMAPILFQAGDHQELNLAQIPTLGAYTEALDRTIAYMDERRKSANQPVSFTPPVAPRNHCGVGHGEISVDPGGFVYPCQSLHFDEFVCGNVRETSIEQIFRDSPVMKKVRGATVGTFSVCSHCDLKHLCNGGCRATAYNVYHEFDHHNEIYCKTLETMAVRKMWASADQPAARTH